jgi:hypothetical protein
LNVFFDALQFAILDPNPATLPALVQNDVRRVLVPKLVHSRIATRAKPQSVHGLGKFHLGNDGIFDLLEQGQALCFHLADFPTVKEYSCAPLARVNGYSLKNPGIK